MEDESLAGARREVRDLPDMTANITTNCMKSHRRGWLTLVLGPLAVTLAATPAPNEIRITSFPLDQPTVVQRENAKPGTLDWQLALPAHDRLSDNTNEVEGYASLTSVNRGGQIKLFVNTAEPGFTMEVFRLGWYQGKGGRRMTAPVHLPGVAQALPVPDPVTGLVECRWTDPITLDIPLDQPDSDGWVSGLYVAKLTADTTGRQSYILFVVRDDARPARYLMQSAASCYQAYNDWGGESL